MNFEFSAPNLPELETVLTNLLSNSKCNCHFINPSKTRILLWKETKKDGTVIYHLRIGIQKFISQDCLDRNGETYWKFEINSTEIKRGVHSELSQKEPDPITKFNHRQEQAQDYGKSNNSEPAANNQSEQSN